MIIERENVQKRSKRIVQNKKGMKMDNSKSTKIILQIRKRLKNIDIKKYLNLLFFKNF